MIPSVEHMKLKILRQKHRARKRLVGITGRQQTVYVWEMTPLYKKIWQDAARELSASFTELADDIWEVRHQENTTRIVGHEVQLDDPVVLAVASDKAYCYRMLEKHGLPVPKFAAFSVDDLEPLKRFTETYDGYYVVKPAKGTSAGMGITTHLRTYSECLDAAALASLYTPHLLVEQLVPGESCRLLVLDGRVIHASRRRGIRVTGDGTRNIRRLLAEELQRMRSRSNDSSPEFSSRDRDLDAILKAQGLSEDSVPEKGKEMFVKSMVKQVSVGREERTIYTENITGRICPEVREQAALAANIIGSRFTGIDIITSDISSPLAISGGKINEVNTTPGLQHHYDLENNDGRSPAVDVLRCLLKVEGKNNVEKNR